MHFFKVILFANAERCELPGYRQWLEAFDQEARWAGSWLREPRPGMLPHPEMRVRVLSRLVASASGAPCEAMRRFNEWQQNGHDEAWLTATRVWNRSPLPRSA
jgi:hypothetical protein